MKPFMSFKVLKMTYFSYVHPILSYGIIFCGIHLTAKVFSKFRRE